MDLSHQRLVSLLQTFGDLLPNPLGKRLDLVAYASKLLELADMACAIIDGEIVGFLALYANDQTTRRAHLPILSILPARQGQGLGKAMMSRALALVRQRKMREFNLGINPENTAAQRLYLSCGFRFDNTQGNRWSMKCDLPDFVLRENATPIEEHPRLLSVLDLDIDIRIKRDDLYPSAGGGIKARKIEYIMRDLIARGHDVIVTNGGPQSNHARASAVMAATLGIKCHLVVVLEPGIQYLDTGNILLMRLSGATIEFCKKDQLAQRMDQAVEFYTRKGHNPLYVWGGGHCLAGTVAFVDAAAEAQAQCGDWQPEFVVLASGTGTTQAGLAIGYSAFPTRVIGISVARDATRGIHVIQESINQYFSHTRVVPKSIEVDFRDNWIDGSYERTSTKLLNVVSKSANVGVFVDSTYSGKALRGLIDLVKTKEIPPGSRVLFWHTGGLMNLLASPFAGGMISL